MTTENTAVEVPARVLEYLDVQSTLTLATASPRGVPRATTLTYVHDGMALYVWTRPDTTTAGHISENPVVGFAIDEYSADWRKTQGVQGAGEAQVLLNPAEIDHVLDLFSEKFADVARADPSNISLFRITPTELQFIDNSSGGGDRAQAVGIEYHRDAVYSVFRDLPREEVSTLVADLQTVEVEPGTVIVRQGAPADKFFVIVEGEVEVIHEGAGDERTLAHLRRGQFFGEMAILRDAPRAATVRAVEPTTLFAMERESFRALVAQSLGTTQDFDRTIRQRLDEIAAASGE